jgi:UDPglucose 6-dehydrogenase
LKLVGDSKTAVIKSTLKVGTTDKMQKLYPNKFIIHSPEFLTEVTAAHDAKHPNRNIVGYTKKSKCKANLVLSIMAKAPMNKAIPCKEAELLKYAGNIWFYMKVVTINTIADLCLKNKVDYETIKECLKGDPRVGDTHLDVLHKKGRGAGGHCFIKDFSCFKEMHKDANSGKLILDLLTAAEKYNNKLLISSKKDLDILSEVYNIKK